MFPVFIFLYLCYLCFCIFDYGKGRSQYAVSEAGRGWLKSGTGVGEEAENEEEEEELVVVEEEEEGGGGVVFEKVVGN